MCVSLRHSADKNHGHGHLLFIQWRKRENLDVFGWFSIPSTITSIPNQEDVAGQVHLVVASTLLGLVLLHATAALKHHYIDRDDTLKRILGR